MVFSSWFSRPNRSPTEGVSVEENDRTTIEMPTPVRMPAPIQTGEPPRQVPGSVLTEMFSDDDYPTTSIPTNRPTRPPGGTPAGGTPPRGVFAENEPLFTTIPTSRPTRHARIDTSPPETIPDYHPSSTAVPTRNRWRPGTPYRRARPDIPARRRRSFFSPTTLRTEDSEDDDVPFTAAPTNARTRRAPGTPPPTNGRGTSRNLPRRSFTTNDTSPPGVTLIPLQPESNPTPSSSRPGFSSFLPSFGRRWGNEQGRSQSNTPGASTPRSAQNFLPSDTAFGSNSDTVEDGQEAGSNDMSESESEDDTDPTKVSSPELSTGVPEMDAKADPPVSTQPTRLLGSLSNVFTSFWNGPPRPAGSDNNPPLATDTEKQNDTDAAIDSQLEPVGRTTAGELTEIRLPPFTDEDFNDFYSRLPSRQPVEKRIAEWKIVRTATSAVRDFCNSAVDNKPSESFYGLRDHEMAQRFEAWTAGTASPELEHAVAPALLVYTTVFQENHGAPVQVSQFSAQDLARVAAASEVLARYVDEQRRGLDEFNRRVPNYGRSEWT